jgi:hypothetical protein
MLTSHLRSSLCAAWLVWACGAVLAHEAVLAKGPPTARVAASEEQAIEKIQKAMKHLFDKPQSSLTVNPVAIEGDHAVAGWTQEQRGGRALLHLENQEWRITLCGGDGLVQADTLAQSGLSQAAAKRLAQKIRVAEARLSAAQRQQLSTFDGIVTVGAEHDPHHPGGPAAKH